MNRRALVGAALAAITSLLACGDGGSSGGQGAGTSVGTSCLQSCAQCECSCDGPSFTMWTQGDCQVLSSQTCASDAGADSGAPMHLYCTEISHIDCCV